MVGKKRVDWEIGRLSNQLVNIGEALGAVANYGMNQNGLKVE